MGVEVRLTFRGGNSGRLLNEFLNRKGFRPRSFTPCGSGWHPRIAAREPACLERGEERRGEKKITDFPDALEPPACGKEEGIPPSAIFPRSAIFRAPTRRPLSADAS